MNKILLFLTLSSVALIAEAHKESTLKALIARKNPDPASVTWIEPKILKRQAREAAESEARAAQEGESNE